jgi:RimJ/RimL family protein N-acetyltransferase
MKDIFRGKLVRITNEAPDVYAKASVRWQLDSEYGRLLDSESVRIFSEKAIKEWNEKRQEKGPQPERYGFSVRTLAEDKLIGFFGLYVELIHSEAWVGIGIGERDFWSKGYGTDMMNVCLRYAFLELGVERVSLGLHEYNPRALRSYEKAGFKLEGRTRQDVMREGKRTDTFWMGILRDEWMAQNGANL